MGFFSTYQPPKGEECETSVEHGLPLWAQPAVGYCSRRPGPSPMWGSRSVGAPEVGLWVTEQRPLGKTHLRGKPSPEMTYLPTTCGQGEIGRKTRCPVQKGQKGCTCQPTQVCKPSPVFEQMFSLAGLGHGLGAVFGPWFW